MSSSECRSLDAQFRFQGRDGRLHERESLRGHRLVAARDVDDAEDGAGMRVGDAHGRATPRMRQLVEILGPLNLDSVIEGQGRARRARADPALGPVRPLDEQHPLRLTPHGSVTVDPERATELVTDGHDQAGVKGVPDEQVVHDREHGGQRMPVAQLVGAEFVLVDEPQRIKAEGERPLPGLLHQLAHARTDEPFRDCRLLGRRQVREVSASALAGRTDDPRTRP
ncbi:hypothetical protein E3T25_00570 [Cryobacterium sandaracinum]|uniref:Uncharacterized protein n=1 Tax=Cryobacterium sandaracinum TaxID=1259247 RepID=A0ABY2JKZ8_9MICO|nr:hypothetical protein [Cryobacterium sandaracinum]TFD07247.1 hypothetical protein E3T25_00570 [Cryobacterium sandaracinum]